MTLPSNVNALEGSRPTYPPQLHTFTLANVDVAQFVAREAENPMVLCSNPDFDHFLPKKKAEKRCQGTLFCSSDPRTPGTLLFLGWRS